MYVENVSVPNLSEQPYSFPTVPYGDFFLISQGWHEPIFIAVP